MSPSCLSKGRSLGCVARRGWIAQTKQIAAAGRDSVLCVLLLGLGCISEKPCTLRDELTHAHCRSAWDKLKGKSSDEAKQEYIMCVCSLV